VVIGVQSGVETNSSSRTVVNETLQGQQRRPDTQRAATSLTVFRLPIPETRYSRHHLGC
jgi:hypothetical protein